MRRISGWLVILITVVAAGVLAPWLSPHDPLSIEPGAQFAPPGGEYILGSDYLGRDVLSRSLWGARHSLVGAAVGSALAITLGLSIGGLAGAFGGALDWALMRLVDTLLAFPGLLLAIALTTIFGVGQWPVALAVGLSLAPGYSRIARAAVLAVRGQFYIEAAEALGASQWRVLWVHILPNIAGQATAFAVVTFSWALMNMAALDFLGLGASPSVPTWGNMLNEGRTYLRVAPWIALVPGILLGLTVVSVTGLSDAWRRSFRG